MFFGIYEIVNPKEKGKNLNFVFWKQNLFQKEKN